MLKSFKSTIYACYVGYITQAIINNLAPLLFVTFQSEFKVSLSQIGLIVSINFGTQMIVDFIAAKYVDKFGYRKSIVFAHIISAIGLIAMGTLPYILEDKFVGLVIAVVLYAIGGGLIEVLISPIVEACPLPEKQKASAMSLLHSFYCWGHVAVVILSTLFFNLVGINNWRYLAFLWAIVPFVNIFLFTKVPINSFGEHETNIPLRGLLKNKIFWVFIILMICSGASEQAMSQWSSYFAESGLSLSKTFGDLLGPCLFAVLMGTSRAFYGKFGERFDLIKFISASGILCVACYLVATLSPVPLISLIACAVCGLSVGIMWPGVFSLSARYLSGGGTAMFAFLALAGDIGCGGGPAVVGMISNALGGELKTGLLFATIFPIILLIMIFTLKKLKNTSVEQ